MIEKHPWVRFLKIENKAGKLTLGSLPPNKYTVSTEKKTQCDMDLFYECKDNFFWQLFSDAFGLKYKFPDDIDNLKKHSVEKHWII